MRFGLKTTPMHVSYDEILRVWQEADGLPQIEDAWLWDHLLPLAGPADGPVHEGWTLLTALAAQTERLRLGLLVSSNRLRHPAMLGKITSTLDVVSRGRWSSGSARVARISRPGRVVFLAKTRPSRSTPPTASPSCRPPRASAGSRRASRSSS
ncbi:LLM class flavin-dependent oxidoreductase [Amycolatopsis thermoflava]|uniref:LLM class flavin-dependent oxidoreductase n=1 Tax=Amycolatopsis thermoflava TaxID=84480 RepID=UPI0037F545C4